jgi:hypothetical protein
MLVIIQFHSKMHGPYNNKKSNYSRVRLHYIRVYYIFM